MPYSNTEAHCYMCKEMLKVEKDTGSDVVGPINIAQNGLGGILNKISDENCYFVDAKRIRISYKNKEDPSIIEKKEVTVHVQCFKQMEIIKQQRLKQ